MIHAVSDKWYIQISRWWLQLILKKNSGQNGFIFSNYKVAKSVVNVGKYLPTVHLAAKSMVNVRKYTINWVELGYFQYIKTRGKKLEEGSKYDPNIQRGPPVLSMELWVPSPNFSCWWTKITSCFHLFVRPDSRGEKGNSTSTSGKIYKWNLKITQFKGKNHLPKPPSFGFFYVNLFRVLSFGKERGRSLVLHGHGRPEVRWNSTTEIFDQKRKLMNKTEQRQENSIQHPTISTNSRP